IESVFTMLPTGEGGREELWKYSRYFDNPQFWTKPFEEDVVVENGKVVKQTKPVAPEFEMYNVTQDKLEKYNLAHSSNGGRDFKAVRETLDKMLSRQRAAKRLYPEPLPKYIKSIEGTETKTSIKSRKA